MSIFSISIRNLIVTSVLSISAHATLVQSFDTNSLAGSGPGQAGSMNSALYIPILPSPCTSNTQMYAEGSWSVGPNANNCHNLWAPTTAQSGVGSNFLIVNGSDVSNGRIYSQVVNTGGANAGTFSGFFTGLFVQHPANLSISVYDGATSTLLGTRAFDTNLAGGAYPPPTPTPAAWVQQSVDFSGATGSSIILEIALNNPIAGGDDFGVDTLDVAFRSAASPSPVPEPATMLLSFSALVGLALLRSKRN